MHPKYTHAYLQHGSSGKGTEAVPVSEPEDKDMRVASMSPCANVAHVLPACHPACEDVPEPEHVTISCTGHVCTSLIPKINKAWQGDRSSPGTGAHGTRIHLTRHLYKKTNTYVLFACHIARERSSRAKHTSQTACSARRARRLGCTTFVTGGQTCRTYKRIRTEWQEDRSSPGTGAVALRYT